MKKTSGSNMLGATVNLKRAAAAAVAERERET